MKLSTGMKRTLLQIGFGVTGRRGGFYDADNNHVNMKYAQALANRGLVYGGTTGGAPMVGTLNLTADGWKLFEECHYDYLL